jgi:hypothetical protein
MRDRVRLIVFISHNSVSAPLSFLSENPYFSTRKKTLIFLCLLTKQLNFSLAKKKNSNNAQIIRLAVTQH